MNIHEQFDRSLLATLNGAPRNAVYAVRGIDYESVRRGLGLKNVRNVQLYFALQARVQRQILSRAVLHGSEIHRGEPDDAKEPVELPETATAKDSWFRFLLAAGLSVDAVERDPPDEGVTQTWMRELQHNLTLWLAVEYMSQVILGRIHGTGGEEWYISRTWTRARLVRMRRGEPGGEGWNVEWEYVNIYPEQQYIEELEEA